MTSEKIVGIVFLVLMIIDGLYMIKQIVSMACVSEFYDGRKKIIIAFILMIVLGAASIICKQFI